VRELALRDGRADGAGQGEGHCECRMQDAECRMRMPSAP
jgi:hypothetical protein